ncbi:MAG: extracellular solute-binding protein [Armatimonadetes bacterium]|nr:extracellular solute-binding protein [Armatimonadota bacterium]
MTVRALLLTLVFLGLSLRMAPVCRAAEPVTVRVWSLPAKDARSVPEKASLAIVQRFLELHPDIRLEGTRGLQVPGMNLEAGPLLQMAGGVAPDVIYVNFRISDSYLQQKFLYPLDDYFKQWAKEEDLSDLIYPPVWQVIKREGHIWAVPYATLVMTLQYRKDLFREAGLDPEHPPQNWDELWDYARKLTIPEKGQYGLQVDRGSQAAWKFINFLWSAGGDAVKQDSRGQWRAVFNDDAAVTALRFYQKLVRGKWTRDGKTYRGVAYPGTEGVPGWDLGKIGMTFGYLSDESMVNVNPSLIGIAPVPRGPTGLRGNELNCPMMGINSQVKDKRVRDAAWEYIKFWGGEEAARIRCKVFVESGWAKYIAPRFLKKFGYSQYLRQVPKGWQETLDEALRSGRPEPYGRNCEMIYAEMTPPLDVAWASDTADLRKALNQAVTHCNEKLMGVVSPRVLEFRRRVALAFVLILSAILAVLFRTVMRTFSQDFDIASEASGTPSRLRSRRKLKRLLFAWVIMAPALISVALWAYYPLVKGSVMAFQDYKIVTGSKWVGLDNFSEVLFTPQTWVSLWHSFEFMILSLALGFIAPIILALMLHEVPRGKMLFRTLYYLPAVTTGLVIMFLWKLFYDPSPAGVMNQLILAFDHHVLAPLNSLLHFIRLPGLPLIEPQTWLQDPRLAMLCIILPGIWAGVGPGCIIYLAALKGVPEEMYEAADLDGAGVLQKIRFITIPFLRPLIIINFVGAFIAAFRSFDAIFVMTGGGPMYATHVAGLEIWINAFLYLKFGYAVAMSWILGSLLIGFTVFQLRILSRLQFKAAGAQ